MKTMQASLNELGAQASLWCTKLDVLVTNAMQAGTRAKLDHHQRVDDVRVKHAATPSTLDELKESGIEKWLMLKAGVGSAWNGLEGALKVTKH